MSAGALRLGTPAAVRGASEQGGGQSRGPLRSQVGAPASWQAASRTGPLERRGSEGAAKGTDAPTPVPCGAPYRARMVQSAQVAAPAAMAGPSSHAARTHPRPPASIPHTTVAQPRWVQGGMHGRFGARLCAHFTTPCSVSRSARPVSSRLSGPLTAWSSTKAFLPRRCRGRAQAGCDSGAQQQQQQQQQQQPSGEQTVRGHVSAPSPTPPARPARRARPATRPTHRPPGMQRPSWIDTGVQRRACEEGLRCWGGDLPVTTMRKGHPTTA